MPKVEWKNQNESDMLKNVLDEAHTGSLQKVLFGESNDSETNIKHCEMVYAWVVTQLVNSYDKLKSKFNSFAAKCLTEK